MAATGANAQNVTVVGTDASPIALGGSGGANHTWTWLSGHGSRASMIQVVTATDRAVITTVAATQPAVGTIVLTNTAVGAVNVVAIVTWSAPSASVAAPVAASAGTLS